MSDTPYELEFYEEKGSMPLKAWLNRLIEDEPAKYDAIAYALEEILANEGKDVCNTEFGKNLGDGLYEFRLRQSKGQLVSRVQPHLKGTAVEGPEVDVEIRIFFGAYGNKIILLFQGYDKGKDPSKRRQNKEIKLARKRLGRHPLTKGVSIPLKLRVLDWLRGRHI